MERECQEECREGKFLLISGQPSLRDWLLPLPLPSAEALGYWQASFRDTNRI